MTRTGIAVLGAAGCLTAALGCARQTAAPSGGVVEAREPPAVGPPGTSRPSQFDLQRHLRYVDDVNALPPFDANRTRQQVIARLRRSGAGGPRANPRGGTAADVCASLARVDMARGRAIGGENFRAGCYVDIAYATPKAFREFDQRATLDARSAFRQWRWGAGRTGLHRAGGNRLVATWYAINPPPGRSFAKAQEVR
jgi:hypothetical protein